MTIFECMECGHILGVGDGASVCPKCGSTHIRMDGMSRAEARRRETWERDNDYIEDEEDERE